MAIHLKTPAEIEKMRRAGHVVREVLNRLGEMIAPGVTTLDLDRQAETLCRDRGAVCLFKGVPGRGKAGPFPGNICASLNEEVVHGIPSARRTVNDGDIVSVDFGVRLDGWCGDAAETYICGQAAPDVQKLVGVTRNMLALAVQMSTPGQHWSHVARAMQDYAHGEGFSVVEDFVGHGIGREMHEEPKVPNYYSPELARHDIVLRPGMVLAIEPMVNMGTQRVKVVSDGWTVVTRDHRPSAHFEHTVAVTEDGAAVLTA